MIAHLYVSPFREGDVNLSHRLLLAAARQYAGSTFDSTIAFGPFGKPYFPHAPGIHFNITHSGDYWMCAFADAPVGVDLQRYQSCDRADLSRKFFHPVEDAFLCQRGYADFFELWSAKESYLKYTGQGITQNLNEHSVVAIDGRFPAAAGAVLRFLSWLPDYALCICTSVPCAVYIHRLSPMSWPAI